MTLAERLQAQPRGQGMPCSVAVALRELPPEDADALQAALDAPWRIMGHAKIEDDLAAEGHPVGVGSVGKHRRGTCRCSRSPK